MNLSIESKIQLLYTHILCLLLFIKNLLFPKKLAIENFIYTNKIIVRGNETKLNWKTTGCYKILCKDLGVFPGNISCISLTLNDDINPITITFYGIGGQKEVKHIEIKTSSPSISNDLIPIINISKLNSIPLVKENLRMIFTDSFSYREPKHIKIQKPIILSQHQNLKINFDPFIKSNHLIKT